MGIREDRNRFLVTVERASALKGYRRIRKYVTTREEAERLDDEIKGSLEVFGKWPVEEGDKPLPSPAIHGKYSALTERRGGTSGTLREATTAALNTHWSGKRYHDTVKYTIMVVVDFMESRGKFDIDSITSEDIDELVKSYRDKGNSPGTINKALGALAIVNRVAVNRLPPLATITLPIIKVSGRRIEKWWLRPDDHVKVVDALRDPINGQVLTDPLFADLIDVIVFNGLRVEEALRLEERMLIGLDSKEPWLQPPGTKTADAQNSIPIYPQTVEPLKSAIERARRNRWSRLFPLRPRQVAERWNDVRDFLGVRNIPTSTMKSLRRTFAWYANNRGMPTSTLQKVLRHKGIGTTAGYLDLVGDGSLKDSRKYFGDDSTQIHKETPKQEPAKTNVAEVIAAYAATGASPEQIARLVKELMG